MAYLEPSEYVLFGLDAETPDSLVGAASALVDGFCRRPSLSVTGYVERLRPGRGVNPTVRLSHAPVVAITGCRVRLRRPDVLFATPLQLDAAVFGLGGAWTAVDPASIVLYANGEAELPEHTLGLNCDEVELSYTAGFAEVPQPVKLAVAHLVRNAASTPGLNVKRQEVDALAMEYFGPSLLDEDVKRLLASYVSVRLA